MMERKQSFTDLGNEGPCDINILQVLLEQKGASVAEALLVR